MPPDKTAVLVQNYERALASDETEAALESLQRVSQLSMHLDKAAFVRIWKRFSNHPSSAIIGELCYLMGRRGESDSVSFLLDHLNVSDEYVCTQASEALFRVTEQMGKHVKEDLLVEEKAYLSMEERLIAKYPGQFAGFYKGKLVAVKPDRLELMRAVEKEIGHARYYIRMISRGLPVIRLPETRSPRIRGRERN